ncbi:MAG: cyclic nucleotide-binding domain-containing protein, partial [Gammaproteobacteria bacterium]
MKDEASRFLLRRNALFRELPDDVLDKVTGLSTRRRYAKGETVFLQGDPGDALYGVVSGTVRISCSSASSAEVFLNIMEPGDSFGEIALLDGKPRTASAIATSEADLMIIQRAKFLGLLKEEHTLTLHLLELCCE